jgi:hypothetical protein
MKTLFSAIAAIAFSIASVGAATIDLDRNAPAAVMIAGISGDGAAVA